MHKDRSFDGLADVFEQRINNSIKGKLREDMLCWHLETRLPALHHPPYLNILDAGGGLGQMSIHLARMGHRVTLNDVSGDMLAIARQRIDAQLPLDGEIVVCPGPLQNTLADNTEAFDVIVCHAMLEWLSQPEQVLQLLIKHLKPGGTLSLAFYNRHALALKSTLVGYVDILLPDDKRPKPKRKGLSPPNPQFPEDVFRWCEQADLELLGNCGIRVMSDWMPKETLNSTPYDTLLAIEKHYCQRLPYRLNGRYVHGVFRKPAGTTALV